MTELIFWEAAAVFATRCAMDARRLRIGVGRAGVLTVMNSAGVFRFPAEAGTVTVREGALSMGENRMVYREGDRLYHVESLWREGDVLTPMGGDPIPLLCEEKRKNGALRKAMEHLEARLCLLEEAVFDSALFDATPEEKEEER
jgi:hypothetical protein